MKLIKHEDAGDTDNTVTTNSQTHLQILNFHRDVRMRK